MQMNALRSANLVKLSSSNATSDEYWLTSMSAGTPGGYCLSQIRSMGLSPQNLRYLFFRFRLRSPDRLVSGSIGNAAQYGKRLRVIDALACHERTQLTAVKPLKSRAERSAGGLGLCGRRRLGGCR